MSAHFNCDLRWHLNQKPYVWVESGHDTDMGREVAKLGEIERRELAFQLMSVINRGESVAVINGIRFELNVSSYHELPKDDYPEGVR